MKSIHKLLSGIIVAGTVAAAGMADSLRVAPTHLVDQPPVSIKRVAPNVVLVDFGRVAFGNLRVRPPEGSGVEVVVHFGEALREGRIDRRPPGTVRYVATPATLQGDDPVVIAPPADRRNTEQVSDSHPPAVLTPSAWGVILPFRWVEIEGWPGRPESDALVRQAAFSAVWDDGAASFECSDPTINAIWELCRYSIKATTFAGVYVDGDRERIPYEADAYLNQLSHYGTDNDSRMARDTFDWLMRYPTWPTEWAPHMIFMAYADWRHTGDADWLSARYESLKPKLLLDRARDDGLITSNPEQVRRGDIVDWPKGERDGYVFTPLNTVVNAFHLRALAHMAELAQAIGKGKEADRYREKEQAVRRVFHEVFFDAEQGRYRDGIDTDHASLHANLFPLAFGLVPEPQVESVTRYVAGKGMACSVYVAQYLMEALFENGAAEEALALITAPGDRSWRHMVESGTTITWEAWDQKYKPNQDWNHAWGAAPANLLPRYVLGAQPLEAGWTRARIRPHVGSLTRAGGVVPTPRGPIRIRWNREPEFSLAVELPDGVSAAVELPAAAGSDGFLLNGQAVAGRRVGDRWIADRDVVGKAHFTTAEPQSDRASVHRAEVLGETMTADDSRALSGRVLGALLDAYARERRLAPSAEELDQFAERSLEKQAQQNLRWEADRKRLTADLASSTLSDEEREQRASHLATIEQILETNRELAAERTPDQHRAAQRAVGEHFVGAWKINRALYREYGGRVIFQQAGPEPLDAYREFLEERQAQGAFRFPEEEDATAFWTYFTQESMHVFCPEEQSQSLMETPWWLMDEPVNGE